MSLSKKDPFDLNLCTRGLGNQLTYMFDNIEEFICQFTFRSRWPLDVEPNEFLLKNGQFNYAAFLDSKNRYVAVCARICHTLVKHKAQLCKICKINEEEDLLYLEIVRQSSRFPILFVRKGKPKNIYKMGIRFANILHSFIDCLYSYRCAITLQRYTIPKGRDAQLSKSNRIIFKENKAVIGLLNKLIDEAMQHIRDYDAVAKKDADLFRYLNVL